MKLIKFLKAVFKEFGKDKAGQLSAAFAYVAVFSIGPLLLVLISVIGFIYGEKAASGQLFAQLSDAVGADTARTIQEVVANTQKSGASTTAFVIGVVGMLLGATAITTQLQNSFNVILGVVPDPKAGLKRTVYVKAKNVVLVIVAGLLIAASLVISALAAGLGEKARDNLGVPAAGLEALNSLISLVVFVGLLYMIYRVIPDIVIPRKVALSVAVTVAVLFLAGKFILAVVIGRNGTASAYGAAASLITLLLWVYYSGQILFLGTEGAKVYGESRALDYSPKKFNLKRQTIMLDSDGLSGRMIAAFRRGYAKHRDD